jgi:hypothetical protein
VLFRVQPGCLQSWSPQGQDQLPAELRADYHRLLSYLPPTWLAALQGPVQTAAFYASAVVRDGSDWCPQPDGALHHTYQLPPSVRLQPVSQAPQDQIAPAPPGLASYAGVDPSLGPPAPLEEDNRSRRWTSSAARPGTCSTSASGRTGCSSSTHPPTTSRASCTTAVIPSRTVGFWSSQAHLLGFRDPPGPRVRRPRSLQKTWRSPQEIYSRTTGFSSHQASHLGRHPWRFPEWHPPA